MKRHLFLATAVMVLAASAAAADEAALSEVFARVNPSVVVIHTVERGRLKSNPDVTATEIGLGSGVLVSADGLVLTAAHVVQVADAVEAKFLDGTIVEAAVEGTVPWADVALLRLVRVPAGARPAPLGDSDRVRIGDRVFVIGAPRNLEHTLTVGYVSGIRTSKHLSDAGHPVHFIQTDAAINEGNSGGPLFTVDGELVGIVSHMVTLSGGSEGLGLAVAINAARNLLLRQDSFWTGLELYHVTGALAAALNIPQPAALLVQRVARRSPGERAGFLAGTIRIETGRETLLIGGDAVLAIQGQPVTDNPALMEKVVRQVDKGEPITFTVLRRGESITLQSAR